MGDTHDTALAARHYFLCVPAPQQEIRGFWAVSLGLRWRDRPLWSLTGGHILFSLRLMAKPCQAGSTGAGSGGRQQGPRREFYTRKRSPVASRSQREEDGDIYTCCPPCFPRLQEPPR